MRAAVVLVLAVLGSIVAGVAPGGARPAAAASWSWPVPGVVTRPFSPPAQRWLPGHRGVDLLTAAGAPVRAAGAGRVSYAGLLAGRGVLVVVHGALRTTYEPVTARVGLGEVVDAGQVIGTVEAGHAGCPVLACLHWGLRRGEQYLDPLRLVEPQPVRLLPLGGGGVHALSSQPVAGAVGAPGPVGGARRAPVTRASGSSSPGGASSRPDDRSGGRAAAVATVAAGAALAGAARRRRP